MKTTTHYLAAAFDALANLRDHVRDDPQYSSVTTQYALLHIGEAETQLDYTLLALENR